MDLESQIDQLVTAVFQLSETENRTLIAVAGPPASGKSTLAEALVRRLGDAAIPCGLVPMDGFHLENAVLEKRGLLDRKGAPETFDVEQFRKVLERVLAESVVPIPTFDRDQDRVVPGEREIMADQRFVVVEGNYLFLNSPNWRDLKSFWSFGVFISPPRPILEERLIQRWIDQGLTPQQARDRAFGNDMLNAATVLEDSDLVNIDLTFEN